MKNVCKFILTFVLTVGLFIPPASADEISDLKNQVTRILKRVETLEKEKAMRLDAPQGISERVSSLESKFSSSAIQKFAKMNLKISGFVQSTYSWKEADSGDDNFEVERAWLNFGGTLADDFSFMVQIQPDDTSAMLRDAWVAYTKYKPLKVKVGQITMPFSHEWMIPSSSIPTIKRAKFVTTLSKRRDIGAMLFGDVLDDQLHYAVAVINGSGKNVSENNESKDVVGLVRVKPFKNLDSDFLKGLTVGGAIQSGRQPLMGAYKGTRTRYDGVVMYNYEKLALTYEYISQLRQTTSGVDEINDGWYAQALYDITDKIRGVVKYEQYDPNKDVSDDKEDILTLGGVYYFSKNTRVDVNFRQKYEEGADVDNNELLVQGTVKF